ncbi:hypothetical protein [Alkalibacillus silvisoli]|uniref:hypothetical protein n=1 Tax=Alkalibacillus silvisoli TaxID=392823 RepID=UPI0031E0BA92
MDKILTSLGGGIRGIAYRRTLSPAGHKCNICSNFPTVIFRSVFFAGARPQLTLARKAFAKVDLRLALFPQESPPHAMPRMLETASGNPLLKEKRQKSTQAPDLLSSFGFRRFDRFRKKILLHHQYKHIQGQME